MREALIIDACRTPRGIGKVGKGALAEHHPQHLAATVLKAIAERNNLNTAEVDDVIWGTSSQNGKQGRDLGRMALLDAGFDTRASGVTLDRFCGSGITAVNLAAAQVMSGMEDLVIGGGTEMMSYTATLAGKGDPAAGPLMDAGNLSLRAKHPQSHQGVCADAIATLEDIPREALDELAYESQQRADRAIREGRFDRALVPVYREDGTVALDKEEFPRPQTTREGLAALKPSFEAIAHAPLNEDGLTFAGLIQQVYPDLQIRHVHHAGNSSGVVDGASRLERIRREKWPQAARPHRGDGQRRRQPDPDAERSGPGRQEGAEEGRPDAGRHRPVGSQRGLRGGGREVHPRPWP